MGSAGVGIGTGAVFSSGAQQSARAELFSPPERGAAPADSLPLHLAAIGVLGGLSLSTMRMIFPTGSDDVASGSATGLGGPLQVLSSVSGQLSNVWIGFVVLAAIAYLYGFPRAKPEDEAADDDAFAQRMTRYQQIHYCETCNLVFDARGRRFAATDEGVAAMVSLNPS